MSQLINFFTLTNIKDLIPLIAVFLGYYGISLQINKNRRVKWIDDFRKQSAHFSSLFVNNLLTDSKGMQVLYESGISLCHFLDSRNEKKMNHILLFGLVWQMINILKTLEYQENPALFNDQITKINFDILSLTRDIITEEEKKLGEIFR